jgi:putative ABC transport system permease protein
LETIAARLSAQYPDTNKGWSVVVRPYASIVTSSDLRHSLYVLAAAVGLVLLIGCVNVANVLLARALTREREVAVRLALGAGTGRLIQQFLIESVLLSASGGALGIAIGYVTMAALKATLAALPLNIAALPMMLPAEAAVALDWRVLLFATALSLGCGVAFGLVPAVTAIRGVRTAPASGRTTTAAAATRRVRNGLVVTEVALAFVLLANAGLLMHSFVNMWRADVGFDPTHVITAELPVADHRFADAAQMAAYVRRVAAAVRAIPGVRDAAFTDGMPMQGAPSGIFAQRADRPTLPRVERPVADLRLVSPSYFRTLGLRLRRGRTLDDADRAETALVAVVNETMARQTFDAQDPIGRHLLMDAPGFGAIYSGDAATYEVVGVVADERMTAFDDLRPHRVVYLSNQQNFRGFSGIVVRTEMEPVQMERALHEAVGRVDQGQVVEHIRTIDELKSESWAVDRLRSSVIGVFATIAVALAAIGIFGVVSYSVAQRTREIGIRAALGATPAHLVALVVRGGMAWVGIGLAAGAAAAFGTTRLIASVLFGVGPSDPMTLTGTLIALLIVALVACYVPARRAAQLDPLSALRTD